MKKFLLLILIINLSLPCYAGLKEIKQGIKNFFYVPTEQELQIQNEKKAKEEVFEYLDKYYKNFENGQIVEKSGKIRNNGIPLKDMLQQDDTKIENLYQNFKKNHNDMKSNSYLYDITSDYKKQYEEVYNDFVGTKIFEEAVSLYKEKLHTYSGSVDKDLAEQFETEYSETYHEAYQNINDLINLYINKYKNISNEVYNYSYTYEKNKLQNFYKQRYGNIKYAGTMDILLAPTAYPQNNSYYIAGAYSKLRVIQKLKNGILVVHAYESEYGYQSHFKKAFIVTNKPYVENQIISGKFLYTGNYSYTNVLGSSTTVWKFKELNEPSENFYFYFY